MANQKARGERSRRKAEEFLESVFLLAPCFQNKEIKASEIHGFNRLLAGLIYTRLPKEKIGLRSSKVIPKVLPARTRRLCGAVAHIANEMPRECLEVIQEHIIMFARRHTTNLAH